MDSKEYKESEEKDIKKYIKIKKEHLKNIRLQQFAQIYNAQTEWYNSWFRYYK